jgi:polysaccharide biosynthesis transport protein
MNIHQLCLIVRARHRLVLGVVFVTFVAVVGIGLWLPPRYTASTSLIVDFKGVDPITGAVLPFPQLMPSFMATELDVIQSRAVSLKVVKALKLASVAENKQKFIDDVQGRGTIEDWLAANLLKKLDVKPARESRIIELRFSDADPEFAAAAANAFARAYIETNVAIKVAPARDSATWFDGQLKQLRNQVEVTQERLSKYQTDKGITSTDQKLDVETAKLAEISSQLVQVQAQTYENSSRQKQFEDFIARDRSVDSLPEVLASPVIQELKTRLSAAETRLNQATSTVGMNHPEYQRAQSEVTSVRKRLRDEVSTAASVISNNLRISQSRERELRDAVASQKTRLLELNRHRDELGVLIKEVENAQKAYEGASQRYTETSLASRIDQSNVAILGSAIAPIEPSFPKLPLVAALSILVGGVMGMFLAVAVEMIDRRVRRIEDLADIIGAQVWGILEDTSALSKVVGRKVRKASKRRGLLRTLREPTLG